MYSVAEDRVVETLAGYARDAGDHLLGGGAVAGLEDKLRCHFRVDHALAVSSATTGLLAAGLALDLRDAEVVTTPYTWGGSLGPWLLLGCRPVFADIDPDTLTLDPDSVRAAVTPRTRAILDVDIFGVPGDTEGLREIAEEHGLRYVVDGAQSLGAYRGGRPAGSGTDLVVLSFTVGKPLCAGEGGAVVTDDPELYDRMLWHSQHGTRQRKELGLHLDNEFALNGRIHPLSAIWASADFEAALIRAAGRRAECFQLLDAVERTGLVEPTRLTARAIEPCFTQLTTAWRDDPQPEPLRERLSDFGWTVSIGRPSVRLLYRQPAFISQFGDRLRREPECPVAEAQDVRRFTIELGGHR